jgi:hypothetical protein
MMKTTAAFGIFLLLLSMGMGARSQECDTIIKSKDTSNVQYYLHSLDSLALGRLHRYSMEIAGIQKTKEPYTETPFFAGLGNHGLFYKDLDFNTLYSNSMQYGIRSFRAYQFRNKTIEYYRLKEPFSELIYVLGPEKEQKLGAKFSTGIFPTTTIGAEFRYIFAPGRYQRQRSDNKSLSITGQFFSKDRRYGIIGNYIYNKTFVYENGGIVADSIFELNLEPDRFVIPVNLNQAENQVRQFSFYGNQYFNLQKKFKKENDSTYIKRKFHAGRLTHSFFWSTETQKYIDNEPSAGFYENIYMDSTLTFDSIYHFQIVNKLMWSNLGYLDSTERKPFYIYGAAQHEYHEFGDHLGRRYFNHIITSAGIYWFIRNMFILRGHAEFVNGSYKGGDFLIDAGFAYLPGRSEKNYGKIAFRFRQAKQKPGWFYQHYSGNHFQWENNFKSSDISVLSLYYSRHRLRAGIEYHQVANYVTLDSMALPYQLDKGVNVLKLIVNKDFRFSIVGIDTRVAYQQVSNKTAISLPELMADVAVFVTLPLFKGATTIQPGVQAFYNTAYFADAYMPALRSFYPQSNKKIGNYVYADVFFNFRIKRARMFFKYSNIASIFGNYNYYMTPSYPMMDAGFRFGISWKFFD